MSNRRRVGCALIAGTLLFGALIAPAGAAAPSTPSTSSTSTTSTTTPPPFGLPTDAGFKLIQQQTQAQLAIIASQRALVDARKATKAARATLATVESQRLDLNARARATEIALDDTRQRLRTAAAEAYVHADTGGFQAAFDSLSRAESALDVGTSLHLIGVFGNNQADLLDEYQQLKARVDGQVRAISDRFDAATQALKGALDQEDAIKVEIATAKGQLAAAMLGILDFQSKATSALSPILGPSRLSAKQMADYVKFMNYKPNTTVPIEFLAQIYLNESAKVGVRGDVAWAQSILETAGFAHPGSAADNNNFAGIGWCDTCKHGIDFPDATRGVRAQMQLLRTYVDPKFPEPGYKDKILIPGSLQLGFRGKVQTWWDLWGTWATGVLYGQRVYDIYERMVAFAKLDPDPPPKPKPPAGRVVPKP